VRPTADEVARVARLVGVHADVREREEIAALTGAALRAEPVQRLASAQRTHRERAFAFSLGPEHPLVTGVLDLIAHERDGTSLIVDYKSDRLEGGEDLEQLVQRDYGFQRMIYALAAIEDGATDVEVAHWFLERPDEWVAVRFAASQREKLREQLLARVGRARAGGYAVTDEPHRGLCLTCPARGGLCSWGETRTMRAR
jgi:ATP-dependent helicase/nuclease subunit A